MHSAYHDLVVLNCNHEVVHERIIQWLSNSKFMIDVQSKKSKIVAVYPGWHGFGITDTQTASELEILLKDVEDNTVVSFYHHTRRYFLLIGLMTGNILETGVDNLIGFLKQKCETI